LSQSTEQSTPLTQMAISERRRSMVSGMRQPTSKETETNTTCLYIIYYTNMLFSICGVAVWNPDMDLYKRYIVYRISFNITSHVLYTRSTLSECWNWTYN